MLVRTTAIDVFWSSTIPSTPTTGERSARPIRRTRSRPCSAARRCPPATTRARPKTSPRFHAEAWDKPSTSCAERRSASSPTSGRRARPCPAESSCSATRRAARLFVSEGLANAFYCLTEVDYINDVSLEFDPARRGGVRFDDPDLAVAWPTRTPVLSAVDRGLPFLRDLHPAHPRFAG